MSQEIKLSGRVIVSGQAAGLAIVTNHPISFLGMVNTETGTFDEPGHELHGKCLKDCILAYPHGKGSSGDTIRMWRLQKFKVAPAAILFQEAEPIHVQGAMLLNVPSLFGFAQSICEIIRTGDQVEINGSSVTVHPRTPRA